MQDPFDQKKSQILKDIYDSEGPDASPKGTIDELCIPIMELINTNKDMVTTSSCSGRVSVFVEGSKGDYQDKNGVKIGAKGDGGHWLFVTHDENEVPNWWIDKSLVFNTSAATREGLRDDTRYILYKFEPLILHVKCRNRETAQKLYTTAMGCGFRESGIGTNNLVGIRISIKLDVPIGLYDASTEKCHMFMAEDYLSVLTKLSLDRFKENRRKLQQLYDAIEHSLKEDSPTKKESKQERANRMMEEGLARRETVRLRKQQEKELKQKLADAAVSN
ncbi:unnamed protein product [Kuraishia capsulata CBS 1993]|uniref:tRNA wybutosine-synthesizing protein 3 n=1 Tax=Kuraishia capsulata CBS 1993 TaxID=1382522 RepID=W6MQ73_9ASCO|nr:uncharacterized protein KUCA_T00003390001 [Kuraishia capsulata CBS 1993]CDK27412.1 unnamed protein product [Kuraishia capsulata CBS 1993]